MNSPLTLLGNYCTVHGYHWPRPVRTVRHHIQPQQYGGPSTKDNLCNVCDTGHYNIHEYIDAMLDNRALPKVTGKERALAIEGLRRIQVWLDAHVA